MGRRTATETSTSSISIHNEPEAACPLLLTGLANIPETDHFPIKANPSRGGDAKPRVRARADSRVTEGTGAVMSSSGMRVPPQKEALRCLVGAPRVRVQS